MKKYWTIFRLSLQNEMQYRFNFFISILGNAFFFVFFFFFWTIIYAQGDKMGNYDLKTLITYYFLAIIFSQLLFQETAWEVSDQISEGGLNHFLVKPLDYLLNNFVQYWGAVCQTIILYSPIIIIGLFLKKYISYPQNLGQWIFFILSFILASLFFFLIFYCIGLLSFWLERIWALSYGFMLFANFMGGKVLPLDLFPQWFVKISDWLPFKYMLFEPAQIFLNKINFNIYSLLIPSVWIIIILGLAHILWKKGIRVYEAYGA